jgi:CheY-like chemotaxis protein
MLNKFKSFFAKPEPLAEAASAAAESTDTPSERRARSRLNASPGLRILVIDDSATVCAVIKKILESVQLTVDKALDAESGLVQAKANRPDLIFLDIVLPRMNGFSALRQLRRDPDTRDIPVIMISGNEMATEHFFGNAIGAEDFMKKPFSRFEVFARIERLLDADLIPRRKLQTNAASGATSSSAPLSNLAPLTIPVALT